MGEKGKGKVKETAVGRGAVRCPLDAVAGGRPATDSLLCCCEQRRRGRGAARRTGEREGKRTGKGKERRGGAVAVVASAGDRARRGGPTCGTEQEMRRRRGENEARVASGRRWWF